MSNDNIEKNTQYNQFLKILNLFSIHKIRVAILFIRNIKMFLINRIAIQKFEHNLLVIIIVSLN